MKKASLVLGILVLVAAIGTGYVLMKDNPESESRMSRQEQKSNTSGETAQNTQSSPTGEVLTGKTTVVYSDSGFAPREITVERGTTVFFDNQTETPMWVATNPHPDHTAYPEFDTLRVTGSYPEPKNDYSFTFDKPGVWSYHNHNFPEQTGTVTVR